MADLLDALLDDGVFGGGEYAALAVSELEGDDVTRFATLNDVRVVWCLGEHAVMMPSAMTVLQGGVERVGAVGGWDGRLDWGSIPPGVVDRARLPVGAQPIERGLAAEECAAAALDERVDERAVRPQ